MFTELSGTGIDICRAKGTGEAKAQTCQPERSVGLAGVTWRIILEFLASYFRIFTCFREEGLAEPLQ
jgi:hypothetical protein